MKNQLVNTNRISISNFTFDSKTNTISFFSTKTNKCCSKEFTKIAFDIWSILAKANDLTEVELNNLKKLCKNEN